YKPRGALNAALSLSEAAQKRGIITHSSGNFAQAVALAARKLGIKGTIVMPNNAPAVKKAAVLGYGAEVVECAPTLAAREATVEEIRAKTGQVFIHPSNDLAVICGQATACMELLEEVPKLDAVVVPVGGGGLIAGTAAAAHRFSPKTAVFGGEPMGADDAWQSLRAGKIIPQTNPQTIADGLRTSLGDQNFPIIRALVKDIIRVEEAEIIAALRLVWERMKIIIEPSSAVALAAVWREKARFAGQRVGIVVSGGNVDLRALAPYF
ncbi:MAG: threonine/serine dehydratase, partial [Bacteroidetes bacterium]